MNPSTVRRTRVFISYRRSDAEGLAGRLATHLQGVFGKERVFLDADSISPGEPFPDRIRSALDRACVVLVVMGKGWLPAADKWYRRRIDDPSDWVRLEVESSLAAKDVHVIPVFADGPVEMPPPEALPASLGQLPTRNGLPVASSTFERDADFLAKKLIELGLRPVPAATPPRYRSPHVQRLSERLQDVLGRRDKLRAQGMATTELDAEVVQIRRQLRDGAPEPGWDFGDGRYLLLEMIGRGGFATVWKARVLQSYNGFSAGDLVAIKVMHAHMVGDSVAVERFFRGARIMAELQSPGVVRIVETNPDHESWRYFVMELMEGGTLRSAVREQRVDQEEALRIILAVSQTLAAAHARGFVHRDVKPANILLSADDEPKLSDFDLVAVGDTTGGTRTAALGTYAYSSSECLTRPQEAGPPADVYSLGMTMLFALTGEDPNPRSLDTDIHGLACAGSIKKLLHKAASVRPRDRHANAGELAAELEVALLAPTAGVSNPSWATGFGQDEFGTFAELNLAQEVVTRLRWIPPGEFLMGSPKKETGRHGNEGPQHKVTLTEGFWLADAPCTQAEWKAVMGSEPSHFKGAVLPVECVSWDDCQAFCEKLQTRFSGMAPRLPTEAEWEYACRAGTTTAFHDGSSCTSLDGKNPALSKLGWYRENSGGSTHRVRKLAPNGWGLFDMHGSVFEWCSDWKGPYSADGQIDPQGAAMGDGRVCRGGSWFLPATYCRSAYRLGKQTVERVRNLGFRLALGQ